MPVTIPVYGTGYYPSADIGANYFAIVRRAFNPFLIVGAFRKRPVLLYYVLRDLARESQGGFNPIVQPVQLQRFGGRATKLSWTAEFQASPISNPIIVAQWNMAGYVMPIDVLITEWSLMQGSGAPNVIIDVIKARLEDYYAELIDTIDTRICSAPTAPDEMDGIMNAVDNGTNYATYGGISRTEYPAWSSPVFSVEVGPGKEVDAWWKLIPWALSKYKATCYGTGPNVVLCSYNMFYKIVTSLSAYERVITETPEEISFVRGAGIQVLNICGLYLLPCDKIVDDNLLLFLNLGDFELVYNPDLFFNMARPASLLPVNIVGYRSAILFAGNFVCYRPWNSFKVAVTSS